MEQEWYQQMGATQAPETPSDDWYGQLGREKTFGDAISEFMARPTKALPFVGSVTEGYELYRLNEASSALRDGVATPEQEEEVVRFLQDAARPQSAGYVFGSILTELPAFMGEIVATGGAYTVGKRGARNLIGKAISDSIEAGTKRTALMTLRKIGGVAGGAAAQTAAIPTRVGAETLRQMLPEMGLTEDEAGKLEVVLGEAGPSFVEALPDGFVRTWIELVSERTGRAISEIPPLPALKSLQAKVLEKYAGSTGRTLDQAARKLAERAGWNGVFEEWGEERVGDVLRALIVGDPWENVIPTTEQALGELGAFAVGGTATRAVTRAIARTGEAGVPDDTLQSAPATGEGQPVISELDVPDQTPTQIEAPEPPPSGVPAQERETELPPGSTEGESLLAESEVIPERELSPVATELIRKLSEKNQSEVRPVVPQGEAYDSDRSLAERLNLELVFTDSKGQRFPAAHSEGVVAIPADAGTDTRRRSLLYHELVHDIRDKDESSFQSLYSQIEKLDPEGLRAAGERYAQDSGGEVDEEEATARYIEEIGAWVEATVQDPGKLQSLQRGNRSLFRKIADAILNLARKLGFNIPASSKPKHVQAARIFKRVMETAAARQELRTVDVGFPWEVEQEQAAFSEADQREIEREARGEGPALVTFLRNAGGLRDDTGDLRDMVGGARQGKPLVRKRGGMSIDEAMREAEGAGLLPPGAAQSMDESEFVEMIRDSLFGEDSDAGTTGGARYAAADEQERQNRLDVARDDPGNTLAGNYRGEGQIPKAMMRQVPYRGEATVKVYRAVPAGVTEMRPGDWVALDRAYAKMMDRGGRILEQEVPASEVYWAGTDLNEWFWTPSDSTRFAAAPPTALQDQLGFYSGAEAALEASPQKKFLPLQIRNALKKQGAKDEELDWLGLDEWIQSKPKGEKIPKEEIAAFMRENAVVVGERVLDSEQRRRIRALSDAVNETSAAMTEYAEGIGVSQLDRANLTLGRSTATSKRLQGLEFGDQELLDRAGSFWDALDAYQDAHIEGEGDTPRYSEYQEPGGENYRELLLTLPGNTYESSHFPEPGIVVHVRFNERTGVAPRSVEPKGDEARANRLAAHAKLLSDVAKRPAFRSQGLDALDVQERQSVLASVLAAVRDDEVRQGVIAAIPVPVVNDLARLETTADVLLNDEAMLKDYLAGSGATNALVPGSPRAVGALVRSVARLATESVSSAANAAGVSVDDLSAPVTGDLHRPERILFIEEIQSDLHQAGREKGYAARKQVALPEGTITLDPTDPDNPESGMWTVALPSSVMGRSLFYGDTQGEAEGSARSWLARPSVGAVPDAPFKTSWPTLALKRMIRWGAENGFDKVAWTTGAMQVGRYETAMRRSVDAITWSPWDHSDGAIAVRAIKSGESVFAVNTDERGVVTSGGGADAGTSIEDIVGKEIAKRILTEDSGKVEGEGLTIGGKGMIEFYDKRLVSTANKLGKRFGAKVGRVKIPGSGGATASDSAHRAAALDLQRNGYSEVDAFRALKEAYPDASSVELQSATMEVYGGAPVHALPITDSMRSSVLDYGQVRFASAGQGEPAIDMSEETQFQRVRRFWQDALLPLRNIEEDAAKVGVTLPDDQRVYLLSQLRKGKTKERLVQFKKEYIDPVVDSMVDYGITLDEGDEYLYARHAPERNAVLVERDESLDVEENPGSGMPTSVARRILQGYENGERSEGFARFAEAYDAFSRASRELIVSGGLETQETVDAWSELFPNYVPLRNTEEGEGLPGIGQGVDIRGPESHRAKGRGADNLAANPLAWSFAQAERSIVRAEKAEVGRAMLAFMRANPNPEFGEIVGEKPEMDPDTEQAPHVFSVKEDGKEIHVRLNEKYTPVAVALKNLGAEHGGAITQLMGRLTRTLAGLSTRYNPVFPIFNAIRDVGGAGVTMAGEKGVGFSARVMRDVPKAFSALLASGPDLASPKADEWGGHVTRYKESGAPITFLDLAGEQEQLGKIKDELARVGEGQWGQLMRTMKKVGAYLGHVNDAVENAVRLAAFVNAQTNLGMSEAEAASYAKDLTTNFERKGEIGAVLNAWYMFSNAGIQGTQRVMSAMKHPGTRRLVYSAIAGAALIDVLNRVIGGDDEDGIPFYDKIPDHVKRTHIVLMDPGGSGDHVTIPLPFVYNFFHALGTNMGALFDGAQSVEEAAGDLTIAAMDSFNPLGGASHPLEILSPTITDPFLQHAMNQDWAGRPIMPTRLPWGIQKPDSEMFWPTANPSLVSVTRKLNELSGGDAYEAGYLDVSPETIEHFWSFMVGGLGTTLGRTWDLGDKLFRGETPERSEVPLVRRLVRSQNPRYAASLFRDNAAKVETAQKRLSSARKLGSPDKISEVREGFGELLALYPMLRSSKKRLAKLYARRERLEGEPLKRVEEQIQAIHYGFNTRMASQ